MQYEEQLMDPLPPVQNDERSNHTSITAHTDIDTLTAKVGSSKAQKAEIETDDEEFHAD